MREISNVREFSGEVDHNSIKEMISEKEIERKEDILKYLKSFEPDCAAGMSLTDEITGESINTGVSGYEDGTFFWDTRHIYHFEKYNLSLNDDFINHVLSE